MTDDRTTSAANRSRPRAGFLERVLGITSKSGQLGCMAIPAIPVLIVIGLVMGQSDESASPSMPPVTSAEMPLPPKPVEYIAYTTDQKAMICRAGMAMMFGRNVRTLKASEVTAGVTRISYRTPDDRKLWKLDCQVDGEKIVWRTVDAFGSNGPGPWRDRPDDDTLTFKLSGKAVAVTEYYVDGSTATETYKF